METLLKDAFVRAIDGGLMFEFRGLRPAPLLRNELVTPGVLPDALAGKVVFVTSADLATLVSRHGAVRYIGVHSFEHAGVLEVTVDVSLAVPPDQMSLCCSGTLSRYERKEGEWIFRDSAAVFY